MARKRHTAAKIVAKLRQVDVLMAQGKPVANAVRMIGVTEVTYYRWRNHSRADSSCRLAVSRLQLDPFEPALLRGVEAPIKRRFSGDSLSRR
jgi:hypothetical protein